MFTIFFNSPIGNMFIKEENNKLTEVGMLKQEILPTESNATPLLKNAKKQLLEYFEGKRTSFNLPLNFVGTEFQQRVWRELINIPYGTTISYKELALRVGNPKAVRAVGGANNRNNFLIVVPCHRVIGANGKLVGYAEGLAFKKWLLELEGSK